MSVEVDGEWGFSLQGKDLQLLIFHTVLAETLALYPPPEPTLPLPEAFMEAWARGLDEYRKLYGKALDFGEPDSYDNRMTWLDFLHGSYKNTHNKYSLVLFQIGQNKGGPRKENTHRIRKELIAKHGSQCQVCHKPFEEKKGRPIFDAHHIVPEACGGKTVLENMVALCKKCHSGIKSPLQELHADAWTMSRKMRLGGL
jgi:hypothetical protein